MVEAGWELLEYKELTGSAATTLTTDAFALKENLRVVVKVNGKASAGNDININFGLTGSINASGSNYRVRRARDGGSTSFGSAGDSIRIVDGGQIRQSRTSLFARSRRDRGVALWAMAVQDSVFLLIRVIPFCLRFFLSFLSNFLRQASLGEDICGKILQSKHHFFRLQGNGCERFAPSRGEREKFSESISERISFAMTPSGGA